MARVAYIHWHEAELAERLKPLRAAGHDVIGHWSSEEHAPLKDFDPQALVISLDRLPSHGRAVAEWFWEARKRQMIPLIFAGGALEKVAATKAKFPKASFCTREEVTSVLSKLPLAAANIAVAREQATTKPKTKP